MSAFSIPKTDAEYNPEIPATARDLARALGGEEDGRGWVAKCPVPGHGQGRGDRNPSLGIDESGGKLLVTCRAGCSQEAVIEELRRLGLWRTPKKRNATSQDRLQETWREAAPDTGRIAEYLRFRGLSGTVPIDIRLHPSLRYYDKQRRHTGTFPAMVAPVRAPDGAVVNLHRTYLAQGGPGKAAVDEPKKLMTPSTKGATRGASVRLADAGETLAVTEGIETGLAVQESTGTPTWAAISASFMAAIELPETAQRVEIWADHDAGGAGQASANRLARRCHEQGREVVVLLPKEPGTDWLDVLNARGAEALRAARAGSEPWEPGMGRPDIKTAKGILHELATSGEEALIRADAPIYARGDALQRPVLDEVDAADGRKTKVARLAAVTPELMIDHLSRAAAWWRLDQRRDEWVPTDPPPLVAKIILARYGEWRFPKIAGVITTPTLRPDGSLLTTPGLDESTRLLLLAPPPMPDIPGRPTRDHARAALKVLDALLADFPIAEDDGASRSVALSELITPVVRGALGAVPLHTNTAPEPGSGKSYLVDLAAAIATGRWCPVIAAGGCDEAELEKRMGAAALACQPLLSLDNVNGVLRSDLLCQLIERPLVEVRVLGESRNVVIENRSTIFATGNNLALSGDLLRRTIRCRMDAGMERPEKRKFRHNPFQMIIDDRGRYVAAALVIARAYIEAGMPGKLVPLASFERWSDFVRSALVWLDCADPVDSMEAVREDDPWRAELNAVVEAWAALRPNELITSSDLAELAVGSEKCPSDPALHEALMAVAGRRGVIDTRSLGYWLRKHRGRIVGPWRIERAGNVESGRIWILSPATTRGGRPMEIPVSSAGDAGDAGDVPAPNARDAAGRVREHGSAMSLEVPENISSISRSPAEPDLRRGPHPGPGACRACGGDVWWKHAQPSLPWHCAACDPPSDPAGQRTWWARGTGILPEPEARRRLIEASKAS